MKTKILMVCVPMLLLAAGQAAAGALYDFESSTPVGSWQTREDTTTNHKGKKNVVVITTKFLGPEDRDGTRYFWVENEVQNYKVTRKGERKAKGDPTVVKVLMDSKVFLDDPANAFRNLQGFGREIIMQTGDSQPLLIEQGGKMAAMAMKAANVEVSYSFSQPGDRESVQVPAGQFDAVCVDGTGHTEAKILIKKIVVDSVTRACLSDKMPFGLVRSKSNDTVNGKAQSVESVVLEYARSGATTKITGEPQRMPGLGDLLKP